jgi:tetratricopeptide (TPR) repeat protein
MQDSIATAVVNALQATMAKFTPSSQVANTEAYNAFLRGEYLRKRGTKQDLERALAAYQEAIRLDSKYAAAWVGIAATYNVQGVLAWMPQKDAYTEARKAVDHALSIDPNLARAHSALATLEWNYLFDFEKARAEALRARALDPIEGAKDMTPGLDALISGRFDESVQYFREGVKRDPLNSDRFTMLTSALQSAGRLAEAESAARNLLDLNPSYASAHCTLGGCCWRSTCPMRHWRS